MLLLLFLFLILILIVLLIEEAPKSRLTMTVRIGLLGSGFVSNFYMLGLQDVPGWEIPVVASPSLEHGRRFGIELVPAEFLRVLPGQELGLYTN